MTNAVDTKTQAIAMLRDGSNYTETAKTFGLSYQQVYQAAVRAGIARERSRQARAEADARRAQAEQQQHEDDERRGTLLDAYKRGELVNDRDTAAKVIEALLLRPALDAGREDAILEALDSIVAVSAKGF